MPEPLQVMETVEDLVLAVGQLREVSPSLRTAYLPCPLLSLPQQVREMVERTCCWRGTISGTKRGHRDGSFRTHACEEALDCRHITEPTEASQASEAHRVISVICKGE